MIADPMEPVRAFVPMPDPQLPVLLLPGARYKFALVPIGSLRGAFGDEAISGKTMRLPRPSGSQ
jgi:hypothetical protein